MTGAAALLLSVNPRLSPPMVYELLRNATTGSAVQAGGTEGVDACTAVLAVVGHGACRDTLPPAYRVADRSELRLAVH
jgi:hypothetical protein